MAGAKKRPGAIIPSADPWLNSASELPQAVSRLQKLNGFCKHCQQHLAQGEF